MKLYINITIINFEKKIKKKKIYNKIKKKKVRKKKHFK